MEGKILLATDFNDHSKKTLDVAIETSKSLDVEIVMVHVIRDFKDLAFVNEMKRALENWKQYAVDQGAKVYDVFLDSGNIKTKVLEYADKHNVGLIIVGFGNKENTLLNQMGKYGASILNESKQSVLIVKNPSSNTYGQILCAIDILKTSKNTLEKTIKLAYYNKSSLKVLHVIPKNKELVLADKELDSFLSGVQLNGMAFERKIMKGGVLDKLVEYQDETKSSLIVIGDSSNDSIIKKITGTLPERLIKKVNCPCLIMK